VFLAVSTCSLLDGCSQLGHFFKTQNVLDKTSIVNISDNNDVQYQTKTIMTDLCWRKMFAKFASHSVHDEELG
jgi:hypothetical protein